MENIVQVQFKSVNGNGYGGRMYTYIADVPVAVGDTVVVPTKSGDGEAMVARINVPEEEIKPWSLSQLKHITVLATVGGLFDDFMR